MSGVQLAPRSRLEPPVQHFLEVSGWASVRFSGREFRLTHTAGWWKPSWPFGGVACWFHKEEGEYCFDEADGNLCDSFMQGLMRNNPSILAVILHQAAIQDPLLFDR